MTEACTNKPEEGRERYSPGQFVTVEKAVQRGMPDLERAGHIARRAQEWLFATVVPTPDPFDLCFQQEEREPESGSRLHFLVLQLCAVA
jgi:hypothetical protein